MKIITNIQEPISHLKQGDTFVRISKYGHVFGIVEKIYYHVIKSIDLGCSFNRGLIKSTTGVEYELNECHKVNKIYNEDEIEQVKAFVEKIRNKTPLNKRTNED